MRRIHPQSWALLIDGNAGSSPKWFVAIDGRYPEAYQGALFLSPKLFQHSRFLASIRRWLGISDEKVRWTLCGGKGILSKLVATCRCQETPQFFLLYRAFKSGKLKEVERFLTEVNVMELHGSITYLDSAMWVSAETLLV